MASDEQDEQRDALTGLFNPRKFYSDLDSAMRDAGQIAYILADLDQFKKVNDTYGHEVGNAILRNVAQVFATRCAALRTSFGPYRHGGESFCLFLTDVDPEKSLEVAESLRAGVERLRLDAYPHLKVTARLAAVTAALQGCDEDQRQRSKKYLLSKAHEAVYCHPKDKKHNQVVSIGPDGFLESPIEHSTSTISGEEGGDRKKHLDSLASLVAVRAEQLRESAHNLERCYDIVVESLGDALELKDVETERHSKRVAALSVGIARAAALPPDRISVIARGAFLHDIGKIGVPESILHKPSPLTQDEMTVMREHCLFGYKIVKKIPFLTDAAEIIYSHHEWYDGTGYPRGLKGEDIPLGARLVAVANAVDSIRSDLPYRPAQSLGAAREEIALLAGRQFDPAVVKSFLSISEKLWDDLRIQIEAHSASNRQAPNGLL